MELSGIYYSDLIYFLAQPADSQINFKWAKKNKKQYDQSHTINLSMWQQINTIITDKLYGQVIASYTTNSNVTYKCESIDLMCQQEFTRESHWAKISKTRFLATVLIEFAIINISHIRDKNSNT